MKKIFLVIFFMLFGVYLTQAQNNDLSEVYALKRQANTQKDDGSFTDALVTIDKALDICKKTVGKNDTNYVELLCIKSEFYYYLGEFEKSLHFIKEAKRLQIKLEGKMSKQYIELLQDESACYMQLGNQQLALNAMDQAILTASNCIDTTDFYFATILSHASYLRRELGMLEESVKPALRAVEIMEFRKAIDSIEYPEALCNCAQSLYLTGAYNEAYNYADQSVDSYKKLVTNTDYNYLFARLTLVRCMIAIGMYDNALVLVKEVQNDFVNTYGKDNPDYCTIQGVAADIYSAKSDYGLCIRELMDAIAVSESIYGFDAMENLYLIGRLGNVYNMIGNGTKALLYANRCVEICRKNKATKTFDYTQSLACLASAYKNMGMFDSAYTHQSSALKMIEKELGSRNQYYIDCLGGLAEICRLNHDFDKAFNFQSRVVELTDSLFGEMSQPGAYSRLSLADIYNDFGYYGKARSIAEESLDILRTVYDDQYHKDCRNVMERLTIFYNNECKYEMAINISSDLVKYAQNHLSEDNIDYSHYLYLLSICYSNAGQFPKAVQLGEESRNLIAKYYDRESTVYVDVLNNLAIQYKNLGNISDAIRCREEELSLCKKMYGSDVSKYLDCISDLSQFYAGIGKEDKASETMIPLQLFSIRQTNQIMKHTGYKDTISVPDEKKLLDNSDEFTNLLTSFYDDLAIAIEEDSDIKNKVKANEYLYSQMLMGYSMVQFYDGKPDMALRYLLKLLPLREEQTGKENSNYSQVLGSIAQCYARLEKYDSAMVYIKDALKIESQLVDSTSPSMTKALGDLILYARMAGIQDSVEIWTSKLTRLVTKQVKQKFIELSSSERAMFWEGYRGWFDMVLPSWVNESPSPLMVETALDGTLFSKGMLLSTDMELRRIIQEKGNDVAVALYDTLMHTLLWIDKLYSLPVEQRKVSVDSLGRIATLLERRLALQSTAFGDIMASLNVGWKDIREKLKSNEAAIEFVHYRQHDTSFYAAFVIRHGVSSPYYVPLQPIDGNTILQKNDKGYDTTKYSTTYFSQWLWGTLSSYLKDVNVIYFSPTGELHSIAIEVLPDFQDETKRISDRWQLYRLSSSRELVQEKDKVHLDSAAIYGGIRYDTDINTLERDSKLYPTKRGCNLTNYENNRMGGNNLFGFLPGSKIEALFVDSIMSTVLIGTKIYSDTAGTEASFKNLSGRQIPFILVSTHGFYFTPEIADELSKGFSVSMLSSENEKLGTTSYSEDKALTRSGLCFAGVNNMFNGNTIPDDIEDGILTAKEIARMDLRGLDLIVLSACQTGLGDISGDGVFGMQRGFKKAGTKSMLMSLWSVNDYATFILMSNFYENLLVKKMSKQMALMKAQESVRNYEIDESEWDNINKMPKSYLKKIAIAYKRNYNLSDDEWMSLTKGFDFRKWKGNGAAKHGIDQNNDGEHVLIKPFYDPYYWAAFILLDGLD